MTDELIDACLAGAHAFLEGLDIEARAHLGVAGGFEVGEQSVAGRRVEDRPGRLLRRLQGVARGVRGLLCIGHRRLRLPEPRLESLALGDGRLVAHGRAVDLLGVRRQRRVVLAQALQRLTGEPASVVPSLLGVGEGFAQRVGDHADLGETIVRRVSLGRKLETRPPAARAGAHGVLGDDLTRTGHDGDRSAEFALCERPTRRVCRGEVVDDHRVGQYTGDAGRRRDDLDSGRHTDEAGEGWRHRRSPGDGDVDPSEVGFRRGAGEVERRGDVVDEHAFGERAEGGRDRGFEAGRDFDGVADEASDAGTTALDQRRGGVSHVEGTTKRRGLRGERLEFAFGGVQALAQCAHLGLGGGGVALRAFVGGGVLGRGGLGHEVGVDGCESAFGIGAARERGIQRVLLAVDGGAHRVEPRRGGIGGAAQLGDPHVVLRDERALRRDVGVEGVEFSPRADHLATGGSRRILRVAEPRRDLVDLGARLVDARLADRSDFEGEGAVVFEQGQTLTGERVQAAQSFLHALERERDTARRVDDLGSLLVFEGVDAGFELIGFVLQHEALGVTFLLAARVVGELGAQAHEFVGIEPRLRVAHDGRDRRGFASDLGLLAEGFELPAQLAREVAEAGQVGLHRLELSQGLLFAAAMLQDAGRFFDETAPILRARLQHAVEPPLADDDVHLTAETRVAQQLLHIEQSAALPVDRVLARAVAKERATDRHLAVLDRQRPIGVVDSELHLGAAERPTRRGAGEDDVFHLPAAQGLRALLPHDPRERVDDVGFARAVRPDDGGDARFEGEGGRLRERLEALERQALQVHSAPSAAGVPSTLADASANAPLTRAAERR